MLNAVKQPGFGDHDMVVRFRNRAGVGTVLWSGRVSEPAARVMDVLATAVQASPGANSIEIVRTGPSGAGLSYWIQYDYLRVETHPAGSSGTSFGLASAGFGMNSPTVTPGAIGTDLVSALPIGRERPASLHDVVWLDGSPHGTLTYVHTVPMVPGVHLLVEASPDLADWSEAPVVVLHEEGGDGWRRVTVLDLMPLDAPAPRFLRVRAITNSITPLPY